MIAKFLTGILITGLLVCSQLSRANDYTQSYRVNKVDIVSNTTDVDMLDPLFADESAAPSDYVSFREVILRLKYDREQQSDLSLDNYFRYTVHYDLKDASGATVLSSGSLNIHSEAIEHQYEDVATFSIPQTGSISSYGDLKFVVTNVVAETSTDMVTWANVTDPYLSTDIPDDIRLELQIQTERYPRLDHSDPPSIGFDPSTGMIYWTYVEGAESFDVEYVFIDELSEHPDFSTGTFQDPFEFKSPTRINSPFQHYKIDMVYPEGTLYFRVRALGRLIDNVAGDYTYNNIGNWGYTVPTSLNNATQYTITNSDIFEDDKNWLYQINFAEDGKSKSVISYHDGSLRNRQTVSYSNSDEVTLIAEQEYDYEGRASVSVLPAPKLGYDLNYHEDFNMIQVGGTGPLVNFGKEHFDGVANTAPLSSAPGSVTYGAAQYFSENNQLTTDRYRDAIPDAKGYVYSEVEYLRDGTGRVRKSSGIGEDFAMGSGREMQYFYGTTNEVELRRLFGKDVGKASHYKKNLVLDPNDQTSVSYHDQEGRTIATALIGDAPDNLISLGATPEPITTSLIDNNVYDEHNGCIKSVSKLLNVSDQVYAFNYDMTGTIYQMAVNQPPGTDAFDSLFPLNICAECSYDLTITITDPDGNEVDMVVNSSNPNSSQTPSGTYQIISEHYTNAQIGDDCDNGSSSVSSGQLNFTAQFTDLGEYTVVKTLCVNNDNVSDQVDGVLTDQNILLQNLIDDYQGAVDLTLCATNCEQLCQSKAEAYVASFEDFNGNFEPFAGIIDEYLDTCNCDTSSLDLTYTTSGEDMCEILKLRMMQDVTPDGHFYQTGTGSDFWQAVSSSLGSGIDIYESYHIATGAGVGSAITSLSYVQDADNYQDEWAQELIEAHREYCHLQYCEALEGSRDFDMDMANYSTWSAASSASVGSQPGGYTNHDNDPFEINGVSINGTSVINSGDLDVALVNYTTNYLNGEDCNGNPINESLIDWVDPTSTPSNNACLYDSYTLSTSEQDERHWQIYSSQYRYVKEDLVYQAKQLDGCLFYDDGHEIMVPPTPLMTASEITNNTLEQLQLDAPDCETVCSNNVSLWMNGLIHSDCANLLVDVNGNDIQEKDDLEDALYNYCLSTCGYENPQGFIITADLSVSPKPSELTDLENAINDINNNLCTTLGTEIIIGDIATDNPYTDCEDYVLPTPASNCFKELVDFVNTKLPTTSFSSSPAYYNPSSGISASLDACIKDNYTASNNYVGITNYEVNIYDHNQNNGLLAIALYDASNSAISTNDIMEIKDLLMVPSAPITGTGSFSNAKCKVVKNNGTSEDAWIFHNSSVVSVEPGVYSTATYCIPTEYNDFADLPADLLDQWQDDCEDFLLDQAGFNAEQDYQQVIDIITNGFLGSMNSECISNNLTENFTVTYQLKEYQYTLYYYDQAGNLVQTVPPEGVDILPSGAFPSGKWNGSSNPQHTLNTTYAYNSAEQPVSNESVDGGKTEFAYDDQQRLRFSQDAQQKLDGYFSYTKYDQHSRIIEVGESTLSQQSGAASIHDLPEYNNAFPAGGWNITRTYYDDDLGTASEDLAAATQFSNGQTNLRGRINRVEYIAGSRGVVNSALDHKQKQYYCYDEHGNVNELLTYNQLLEDLNQQYKITTYQYDLISGNVNQVSYQDGNTDAFYHQYYYDAENRLTLAMSSHDGYIWDKEAKYFYYLHGPLARIETGEDKVQGTDYAYTIHGWLKGVNSSTSVASRDLRKDGNNTINQWVAQDAYGFSLGYFNGDYNSIENTSFLADISGSFLGNDATNPYASLYNGNISSMITALHNPDEEAMTIHGNAYRYDQLNRIKNSYTYANVSGNNDLVRQNNTFTGATDQIDYNTSYQFDKNGNLTNLTRNAHKVEDPNNPGTYSNNMDNFTYNYIAGTNKLDFVTDNADNPYDTNHDLGDILDGQSSGNYQYNEIGQLTADVQENIAEIKWNAAGKVTHILKSNSDPDLEFIYGPLGNRIAKIKKPKDGSGNLIGQAAWEYTIYSLDASGNPMAIYEKSYQVNGQGATQFTENYQLKEQQIYGSSRVGLRNVGEIIATIDFTDTSYPTNKTFTSNKTITSVGMGATNDDVHKLSRKMNLKLYEMSNHLGNVLVVVTDRKLPTEDELHYTANIISTSDYYPYGMQKKARTITEQAYEELYRYGFNGMEKDDEVSGSGNSYDFGSRMLNSRLGRWFAVDDITKSSLSPYQLSHNNPIVYIDPDGNDEIIFDIKKIKGKYVLKSWIVEDERAEITFRVLGVGDPFVSDPEQMAEMLQGSDVYVIKPVIDGTTVGNIRSWEARKRKLPFGIGSLGVAVDDYTYLGILLQYTPEILEHYQGSEWSMFFKGAVAQRKSMNIAEKVGYLEVFVGVITLTKNLAIKAIQKKVVSTSTKAVVSEVAEETVAYTSKQLGDAGEIATKQTFNANATQVLKETSQGKRYVDVIKDGVAFESKVGYKSATTEIKLQFAKDLEILATDPSINQVVWVFYRSPVTGKVGASKNLLKLFDDAQKAGYNIKTAIHDLPQEALDKAVQQTAK